MQQQKYDPHLTKEELLILLPAEISFQKNRMLQAVIEIQESLKRINTAVRRLKILMMR